MTKKAIFWMREPGDEGPWWRSSDINDLRNRKGSYWLTVASREVCCSVLEHAFDLQTVQVQTSHQVEGDLKDCNLIGHWRAAGMYEAAHL